MRVLFITCNMNTLSGGSVCSERNIRYIKKICDFSYSINMLSNIDYEDDKVLLVKRPSRIQLAKDAFKGYSGGINKDNIKKILSIVETKSIDTCFIDSSVLGIIISKIRPTHPEIKFITFFHNVEVLFIWGQIKKKITYLPLLCSYFRNESIAMRYSDCSIAINERDEKLLRKVYKGKIDFCMPVSLLENNERNFPISTQKSTLDKPIMLFVGSLFYANYYGISWFVKNIMPHVPGKLLIVGKGFESVRNKLSKDNVEVVGSVDTIEPYYDMANLVIAPIFDGSGMKVKTAEALKYGKRVIGTKEAFVGYESHLSKIGILCNNKREFISVLNRKDLCTYSEEDIYSVFQKNFSDEVMFKKFSENIKKIDGLNI